VTGHEVVAIPREARGFQGHAAGLVTRTAAALLDVVLVAGILLAGYLALTGLRFVVSPRDFRFPDPTVWLGLATDALALTIYLTIAWSDGGRTWGNRVMGLRVIRSHGGRVGWGRAALRALTCLVFPLGLLSIAFDRRSRSVQDMLLGTGVVYDWNASTGWRS
jgi:uncharacterized RDD family membrane protein YckC